jgi:hypothetical protein
MHSSATGPSTDELTDVSCHACGVYDASLRHSAHPAIISMVVSANESARVGIWCAKCRSIEAAKAAAISLLAGWWSARGPKLTIAALRANLRGGEQKPSTNAQMLRGIAKLEYDRRNPEFASMFARAAHSVQPQRENSRLIEELNKGGYRSALPDSPWRFAPFVPVAIVAIVLVSVALNAVTGGEDEPAPTPMVQRASIIAPRPTSSIETFQRNDQRRETLRKMSADELQKQLTSTYDRDLAAAYSRARLNEALGTIRSRVERGEELRTMEMSFAALGTNPAVAPLFNEYPAMRSAYANLTSVMSEATRYYRGGPSIDAMQRTAGESFNVTVDIAFDAIVSDMRGHDERSGALATEVVMRAASIEEMRRDVRIRAAVISETAKAIERCRDALPK